MTSEMQAVVSRVVETFGGKVICEMEGNVMSFESCNKTLSGVFFRLSDDGERDSLMLLGEPEARTSVYQGRPRTQACFPVLTRAGLKVWSVGSKLYRQLRDQWPQLQGKVLTITRHGAKDDLATKYDVVAGKPGPEWNKLRKAVTREDVENILAAGTDSAVTE